MKQDVQNVLVKLTVEGVEIEGAVALPVGRVGRRVLLPVLQRLTDTIVGIAEARGRESGEEVSCKKGCDACCRQMVPIAPTEAFGLGAILDALVPAQAAVVLERFDRAVEKLGEAGVLERLRRRGKLTAEEMRQLDRDYFLAQVACPFLEEGACSIHAVRPLACREFLVTSEAEYCRDPGSGRVRMLPMPGKMSVALWKSDKGRAWVPLVLAREFVAGKREEVGEAGAGLRGVLEGLGE